jgi:hypothetical protein
LTVVGRLTVVLIYGRVSSVSWMSVIGPRRRADCPRVVGSAAVIAPDAHTLTVPSRPSAQSVTPRYGESRVAAL